MTSDEFLALPTKEQEALRQAPKSKRLEELESMKRGSVASGRLRVNRLRKRILKGQSVPTIWGSDTK